MDQGGARTVVGATPFAGAPAAVPVPQSCASPQNPAPRADPAGRSAPGRAPGPRTADPARGEHVHDEHVHGEPAPRRLRRHSVRAQVLAALREALLSGELRPGEVYSAPVLAARFGVSPTPVREAMQQLAGEGAVETVPNRGFRVARRTEREAAELAEVRAMLLVPTVLSVAASRPADAWQSLRPLADEAYGCALRGDFPGYAAADRAFQGALVEQSGNRQLVLLVEELCRRARRGPPAASELRRAAARHSALLDALLARDLVSAERLLREHVAG